MKEETHHLSRDIKTLEIRLMEEQAAKEMILTMHKNWKSKKDELAEHDKEYIQVDHLIQKLRDRFRTISYRLDSTRCSHRHDSQNSYDGEVCRNRTSKKAKQSEVHYSALHSTSGCEEHKDQEEQITERD